MSKRFHRVGWPMAATLALVVVGGTAPAAAPAQSVGARLVELDTNQGRLVTLARPVSDVFVANPSIADVQVRSPTQIYLLGKASGQTTVSATTRAGQVVYAATVRVGDNFSSIGAMLKMALPDADIKTFTMNGVVLLTGSIANPGDAQQAESLVQAFVGDKVKVISRLRSATPLQVNLQVKFAEVSKSFIKNIGANISTIDGTGGFKFGLSQGRTGYNPQFTPGSSAPLGVGFTTAPTAGSLINQVANGSTIGMAGKLFGLDILSALDLGETDGQVVTLAQPNLSAMSGETGSFLAGGEIPIPISQGLGAVSVEYKQYGVSLAYTPTVLSDGRISLRVRPEVSQLTAAGAVTLNGTQIPALSTRRAETTVELGSGQSMVIGGLLQNSTDNQMTKTPGIADVPILGALFRSNGWKRNETELMIVITPYLVKPVNANDIVLPTDGYKAPSDLSRVFMGKLGDGTTGGQRAKPTLSPPGTVPVVGVAAPTPAAPAGPGAPGAPMPTGDTRRSESRALPPKPADAKGGPAAAPGFSL